jgi:DMSO reductase anchor subunit
MHPALSVIFFTVVSGTGYGVLFLLGLDLAFDPGLFSRSQALITLTTGSVFAAAGLTSSLLHLGQPQRAWRALSQWRSSWLSREGVASLLSFVPVFGLGFALWRSADASSLRAWAGVLALFAAITVCCTAKIYTSLKTVHAWCNAYVLPGYLLLGLLGGAAWLLALRAAFDAPGVSALRHDGTAWLVLGTALVGYVWKRAYWRFIDTTQHPATTESATGLGRFGSVRSVEAPHTEENYLTREMGFALARKHARRLRAICLLLIGPLPVGFVFSALLLVTIHPMLAMVCAIVSAPCVIAGIFVERWLFFAEARHVVMLYYGAARA